MKIMFLLPWLLILVGVSEVDWVLALGGRVERDSAGRVTGICLRGTWVTDSDLNELNSLLSVSRLDLSQTRISDRGMLRLKELKSVTELSLFYAEQITDEGMAAIKGWKRLERLDLKGTKITDTTLALLSSMTSLVALDVSFAQITDTGLQHLGSLSGLKELTFGGNKLTEQGLQLVSSLPGLTRLDLSGKQRTDSGLWSVSLTDLGMDPLSTLLQLRELNLSGMRISSKGLDKLSRLTKLEKLDLHGARRISDDAIPNLAAFPNLRWIDLMDSGVTREGFEKLRMAKPQATVLWK